jgi:hypothetical protein
MKYKARKRMLRRQTLAAGPEAATVAIAEKLAKLDGTVDRPRPRRLNLDPPLLSADRRSVSGLASLGGCNG